MIVCTNEQQDGRVNWQNAGLLVTTNKLLPARRFASALLTALPVSVSVCLSVTRQCSIEMSGRIDLIFCRAASLDLSHGTPRFKEIQIVCSCTIFIINK